MYRKQSHSGVRMMLVVAALLATALYGQTTPTCNGLPATIVATAPGQVMGTQGDDVIVGTSGNDQIFGLGGNDTICGLGGHDQITGGQGNDTLFGQAGTDTFFWSPGDGSDVIDGGSESDTLQMSGANINEVMDFSANGNRLRLTRNIAAIVLDVFAVERVTLGVRGGSDLITVNRLAGTGVQQLTLDLEGTPNSGTPDGAADSIMVLGGTGNDQITVTGSGNTIGITGTGPAIEIRNTDGALDSLSIDGMAGDDRISAQGLAAGLINLQILGGPGKDTLTGSQGADVIAAGDDDDTLVWFVGTPADLLGGEAGIDTLQILGSTGADFVTLSAAPVGIQVFNNIDNVTFQADVEQVSMLPGRGADQIFVNTLAGTTLQKITLDLRPTASGTAGDGAADTLVVNGTNLPDNITLAGSAGSLTVSGLAPTIVVQGSEPSRDTLTVNGGADVDVINAQALSPDVIRLILRGGQSNDTVIGSPADDAFTWFPGDGSDTIEGGLGNDTLQVNGANIGEKIGFSANGTRLRFTRDIAAIVLDANEVEQVTFAAQGGADTISFGDLGATHVRKVGIDLGSPMGSSGDAQPDTLEITTLTARSIGTAIGPGTMTITWSPVTISVTGVEPGNDHLVFGTPSPMPLMISSAPNEAVRVPAGQ